MTPDEKKAYMKQYRKENRVRMIVNVSLSVQTVRILHYGE